MLERPYVIQVNVGRSRYSHHSALDIAVSSKAAIICIQEPYSYCPQHSQWATLVHQHYFSIFNSSTRPRAVTYISKLLPQFSIVHLDPDLVITRHSLQYSLRPSFQHSQQQAFTLVNLYNERQASSSAPMAYTAERALFYWVPKGPTILLGDFNTHHTW